MKFLSSLWLADEVWPGKVIKVIKMLMVLRWYAKNFLDSTIYYLW